MFRLWKAQLAPLQLAGEDAQAFLNDSVRVFKQTREAKVPGSIRVSFVEMAPMTRLSFLRMWVVWAALVLCSASFIYVVDPTNPSDIAVDQAVQALNLQFQGSVDAFDAAFYKHAFDGPLADLGFYAKDTPLSGAFKVRV